MIDDTNRDGAILVVTNDGYGKRVSLDEFRQQGRGGIGLIGTKFKNSQSRLATLRIVKPGDGIMIATVNGIVVRQRVDAISVQGRMATGVRLQQLEDDDKVVSVTPLIEATVDIADDGEESDLPNGENEVDIVDEFEE